jgi:hypothetical protein
MKFLRALSSLSRTQAWLGEPKQLPAPAVNLRARLHQVRRLWPQKVRERLTLIYAALFFAAGWALLGLTLGLVASSLPTRPPSSHGA